MLGAALGMTTRKALSLAFYLALIGIGCWGVYEWLVLGGRGVIFKAGGFLALFRHLAFAARRCLIAGIFHSTNNAIGFRVTEQGAKLFPLFVVRSW